MKKYEKPLIRVIKIIVEKGFAVSEEPKYFRLNSIENGGQAW